jgi:hypothetical protein
MVMDLQGLAEEFVRKLRTEEIPSEGHQHRGRKTWDDGIVAALVVLLKAVQDGATGVKP